MNIPEGIVIVSRSSIPRLNWKVVNKDIVVLTPYVLLALVETIPPVAAAVSEYFEVNI